MAGNNENNPSSVLIPLGTVALGSGDTLRGWSPSKACRITGVKLIDDLGITANDTNYKVVTLKKKGGNSVGAYTSNVAGGSAVVREGKALTLSATDADTKVASTDNLEVVITEGGSGVALTDALLQIDYFPL